jgi:hypothetical protein
VQYANACQVGNLLKKILGSYISSILKFSFYFFPEMLLIFKPRLKRMDDPFAISDQSRMITDVLNYALHENSEFMLPIGVEQASEIDRLIVDRC